MGKNNKQQNNKNCLAPLKDNPNFLMEMHPVKMARFVPTLIREMLQGRVDVAEYAPYLLTQECCTAILSYLQAEATNAFGDMVYLKYWLDAYRANAINSQTTQFSNLVPLQIGIDTGSYNQPQPYQNGMAMQDTNYYNGPSVQEVPNPTGLYPYWEQGYNQIDYAPMQMGMLYQSCQIKYNNASIRYNVYNHFYNAFTAFYTDGREQHLVMAISGNQQYARYIQPENFVAAEYVVNTLNSDYREKRKNYRNGKRKGGNMNHGERGNSQ